MAVITVDTTVEGLRRDDVFAWLAKPDHHGALLRGGFADVHEADGAYAATIPLPGRPVVVGYRIREADDRHGGRRIVVELDGRRTRGSLHWSLRTMKPSTSTLVTLHADYRSGRVIGALLDAVFLERAIEKALRGMLDALHRELDGIRKA